MTTWSPDTCGCRIHDYDQPHATFDICCPQHEGRTPQFVLEEHQSINMMKRAEMERMAAEMPFNAYYADGMLVIEVADPSRVKIIEA